MIDGDGATPGQVVSCCVRKLTERGTKEQDGKHHSSVVCALSSCLDCEKSGKAVSKGTASVAVDAQGLNRSWGEIEMWHHVARSESLKKLLPPSEDRLCCGTLSKITLSSPGCHYGHGALSQQWKLRQCMWR